MKIYIYTIPKAGTYFLADFIARLGFSNTGFHVSQKSFLDTAAFDLETNARFPSKTKQKQLFYRTLTRMSDGELAFGHFPVPLMSWMFPDFYFVCAYRHPRRTLVSEFIDFRFRRADIAWISRDSIADDRQAFCAYLLRHGQAHMTIFSQMLGVTMLLNEPLCRRFQHERMHLLNFDRFLQGPEGALALAEALGVDPALAPEALEATRAAETKTKATDLKVDRTALWNDEAEDIYARLDAEAFVQRGRELGWDI